MTDLDMWAGIVGFVAPAAVAVIVRGAWPSWARALATLAVCVIGGAVTAALTGNLDGVAPARAVLIVLGAALAFYRLWWHPSKIAPAIEQATTPTPRGRVPRLSGRRLPAERGPSAAPLPPRSTTPPSPPPSPGNDWARYR